MSNRAPRRRSSSIGRAKPWTFWLFCSLAALAVFGLGAVIVGKALVEAYLRGEGFRRFVGDKSGALLQAQSVFKPFEFSGTSFYSERFEAAGDERAAFARVQLDQIRADISLRRFFDGIWRVEQVGAQRLEVHLGAQGRVSALAASGPPSISGSAGSSWMPSRVEVASVQVAQTDVFWEASPAGGAGALRGMSLNAEPADGGWIFNGRGGHIEVNGSPSLDLSRLQVRFREPGWFVQSAELRQGAEGTVSLTGEMRPGDGFEFHGKFAALPVTPFLADDWRVRLHGNVSGELEVRGRLPMPGAGPNVSGTLELHGGTLEALPVLNQIATFTRLDQFRRLNLSRASAEVARENGRLSVKKLVAESTGLIRVEGGFTVENGSIEGLLNVGVAASTLQWLPGSRERVFIENRGGYVWTPVRVSGPVESPVEDLSSRLGAAAKEALFEEGRGAVREGVETGKGVLKGALDLLLPR